MLRLFWRRVIATPTGALVAVVTLGVGIGANIAIFTIVNSVLLQPLPLPDSERLVLLRHVAPGLAQREELHISPGLYFLYAEQSRTLHDVALIYHARASLTGPENPERVPAARVTPSFFDTVGTPPLIGRVFSAADGLAETARVVLLGEGLWRRRFGGDPGVIGRVVSVDGEVVEVVGVMPSGFGLSQPAPEIWIPVHLDRETARLGAFGFEGVARIADSWTLAHVQSELETMASNLANLYPNDPAARVLVNAGLRPTVGLAHALIVEDVSTTLWILLGAAAFLLLIACANVANLLLVSAERDSRSVILRSALGEPRTRLVGTVLFEGLVFGSVGGLTALPMAAVVIGILARYGSQDVPRLEEVTVDWVVVCFGLAVSVVTGLLVAVLPALRTNDAAKWRRIANGVHRSADGRQGQRTRRTLVVLQITLALPTLYGAGLTVQSFSELAAVDPGFDPTNVLALGTALAERDYETGASRLRLHHEMVDRLRALPGAVAAAAASHLPLTRGSSGWSHSIEGRPVADGEVPPSFMTKRVSPGYFRTMDINIVAGRDFDRLDGARDTAVAILSSLAARTYWPGESALGKGIRLGNPPDGDDEDWFRIVGIVDDVRETALHEAPPLMAYYPLAEFSAGGNDVPLEMQYVVRAPNIIELVSSIRDGVRMIDPGLPIVDVQTLDVIVSRARAAPALVMAMLLIAAGLTLLLGAVGVYGVVSCMVAQRDREIAIRVAIGADSVKVRRLVLTEACGLALLGVVLGMCAALALESFMGALSFEMVQANPLDMTIIVTVMALVIGTCLLASWFPARRATRIDPTMALRAE